MGQNEWQKYINELSDSQKENHNNFVEFKKSFSDYSQIKDTVDKNRTNLTKNIDTLNELSENYALIVKQGEEVDGLKVKVTNNTKSIMDLSELENSVSTLKNDQSSIKESVGENKKRSKELYSKVISFDENFNRLRTDFVDYKKHDHPSYENKDIIREMRDLHATFKEHKHCLLYTSPSPRDS